jgi:alkyl hydroperoxide reductase subunit AhpF
MRLILACASIDAASRRNQISSAIILTMSILKIYRSHALQQTLDEITHPVQVVYRVVDEPQPDTLAALDDLLALTPHLSVSTQPAPTAVADRLVVRGPKGPELIFTGAPVGTELAALVSAIVVAGRGDSGLLPQTRQVLAQLPAPVRLEVFTTPT